MRICLVYPDFGSGAEGKYSEGVACLSAVLKTHHHQVNLLHLPKKISQREFVERVKAQEPDIVGFSASTNMYAAVAEYAAQLRREKKILTICGGVHPTLVPEEVISHEGIDIVCIGEGEETCLELCSRLEDGKDISNIENLWLKTPGSIKKNKVRPLVENLDSLPFPDRSIFTEETLAQSEKKRVPILATRGCPFNCTYCCNHQLRKLYPNQPKYIRFKGIEYILREIEYALSYNPQARYIYFYDDVLTLNKKWFEDFIFRYKERIKLPYTCNSRFNILDEEFIDILKQSECISLGLGIESGSERIRNEVMRRNISREQILKVGQWCRKKGVNIYAYNMLGLPFETKKDILDTVKINARLQPRYSQISIFYPYPKTELYDVCKRNGFLKEGSLDSYYEDTLLDLDTLSRREILFYHKNFDYFVTYYKNVYSLTSKVSFVLEKIIDLLWYYPKLFDFLRGVYRMFTLPIRKRKRPSQVGDEIW